MSEELRQNLLDAGCDDSQIEEFEYLAGSGDRLDLLEAHRKDLLEKLHQSQRQIDCLDYLLYQLRKGGTQQ